MLSTQSRARSRISPTSDTMVVDFEKQIMSNPHIVEYMQLPTPQRLKLRCSYDKCPERDQPFTSYIELAKHMNIHVKRVGFVPELKCNGEHSFAKSCPFTVLGFANDQEKKEHRQMRQCLHCKRLFSRIDNLKTHLKQKGSGQSPCVRKRIRNSDLSKPGRRASQKSSVSDLSLIPSENPSSPSTPSIACEPYGYGVENSIPPYFNQNFGSVIDVFNDGSQMFNNNVYPAPSLNMDEYFDQSVYTQQQLFFEPPRLCYEDFLPPQQASHISSQSETDFGLDIFTEPHSTIDPSKVNWRNLGDF